MAIKIMLVSQYFYPEQFRINDIAARWVKRGYDVEAVCAVPNYPQGRFYDGYGLFKKRKEKHFGVNITRLPVIPRGHNKLMLVLNYYSFVISGFFWAVFTRSRADIVFIHESSPMLQALAGIRYARRHHIPCMIYVTDLWPENVQSAAGINNGLILKYLGGVSDRIYRACDYIFVPTVSFAEAIAARGVPAEKLVLWPQSAEDFYRPALPAERVQLRGDGFKIIFTGNIGTAQGLEILPEAARKLKEDGCAVSFHIVGDGRFLPQLKRAVAASETGDMFYFYGRQPAAAIPAFLGGADAALICLSPSDIYRRTLPAKTQSYMACGIPVIVSADGEAAAAVTAANAGLCAPAGDAAALVKTAELMYNMPAEKLTAMGKAAIGYCRENFDSEKLLDEMDGYINKLLNQYGGSNV